MKVVQRLKANEFYRNLFLLISGNGLAQIIPLIFYPVITRLYSPENFGVIAVLMSIHGILITISTGKYESAIILPRKRKDAAALFNIGVSLTIAVCIILPVITFLLWFLFPGISALKEYFFWYFFLWLPVLLAAIAQLIQGWCTRFKLFNLIVQYLLISNILSVGIRLLLGFAHVESGLIVSFFISQVIAGAYFLYKTNKRQPLSRLELFSKTSVAIAKVHKGFPLHSMPNSLVNALSSNLPVFILTSFFTDNITGQFSIAMGLLFKPILIYNSSVSKVLSQKIVELTHQNKPVWPLIKVFIIRTFLISVIPGIVLILMAPYIFNVVLGHEWKEAGELCRLMVPWAILVVITGSLVFIPNVFGKQYKALIVNIIYFVLRLLVLLIGAYYHNAFICIGLFSISGVLILSYLLLWYRRILINADKQHTF